MSEQLKSLSRWRNLSLKWEIIAALSIKIGLLWILWEIFFSSPQAKHMHLPEPIVTQHLLGQYPVHGHDHAKPAQSDANSTFNPPSQSGSTSP
jgi:hypothetical protein